jgi:hypothetical protein
MAPRAVRTRPLALMSTNELTGSRRGGCGQAGFPLPQPAVPTANAKAAVQIRARARGKSFIPGNRWNSSLNASRRGQPQASWQLIIHPHRGFVLRALASTKTGKVMRPALAVGGCAMSLSRRG